MNNKLFVVEYTGRTGFMRPHNAVYTKSARTETFMTPSRIAGIQRFLGTTSLIRAKISCDSIFFDQCSIRCPNPKASKTKSISDVGTMLNPVVFLGFEKEEDAAMAFKTSICLRAEDVLMPIRNFVDEFNSLSGCEFVETGKKRDKFVGIHRYTLKPMYGEIKITNYFIKILHE